MKRPKVSGKYQKLFPFKKGDQTKYGEYRGLRFGQYIFGSGQYDGNGLELINTVDPKEEGVVEMLIKSKK